MTPSSTPHSNGASPNGASGGGPGAGPPAGGNGRPGHGQQGPGGPGGWGPAWPEEDVISLRDLLEILWRGKYVLIGVFLAVAGLTAVYTFLQAPEYEATSTVLIDTEQASSGSSGQGEMRQMLLQGMGSSRSVQNEMEILRSRSVAQRVARRLEAQRTIPDSSAILPILETEPGREEPFTTMDVVNRLRERVNVSQVSQEVDMIEVTATSTSPTAASLIANLYVEEYLERNTEKSRSEISARRQFLEQQKETYEDTLETIEAQLATFKEEEQVVALQAKAETLVEQMSNLQSMRDETRVELQMARSSLESLREKADEIEPGLAERISSGLDQEIASLQQKKGELETQRELIYSKNPVLRQEDQTNEQLRTINEQIANLQEQIEERAGRYVKQVMSTGGIDPQSLQQSGGSEIGSTLGYLTELQRQITQRSIEVRGHEARLAALEQRIAEYQQDFEQIPGSEIRLAQLERARQANEQIYTFLTQRLQETRVAEQSELGYAETVDEAVPPDSPVSPNVPLNLLLGMVLGGFLGVGTVFLRNAMDTSIHGPEDVEERGYNLIGLVPDLSEEIGRKHRLGETVSVNGMEVDSSLLVLTNPFSHKSEAYRRLRTNIQYSRPDDPVRAVMVTSSHAGEGKTTTAANLAVTLAQAGHETVLVDADLRKPRVHRMIPTDKEPGLVDLLFGTSEKTVEQFSSPIDQLTVIPRGASTPNPSELLGSKSMEELVQELEERFDYVVFDSAPLFAATDSVALSRIVDGTILVAETEKAGIDDLERSIGQIRNVGATFLGTVLNRFADQSLFRGSYGYGYYGYYSEYHDVEEEA